MYAHPGLRYQCLRRLRCTRGFKSAAGISRRACIGSGTFSQGTTGCGSGTGCTETSSGTCQDRAWQCSVTSHDPSARQGSAM